MIKFHKMLFFNTLIVGTLISISAYSWFSMWMGLEINMLSMIPLMINEKNQFSSESAIKYFITQALASSAVLFSIILMSNTKEFTPQNSNFLLLMFMNSALLTKLGAAPFHFWFPEVMEGLNWLNCLILLTWQKIAPMMLIMYNLKMTLFLSMIIIFSSITGGVLGINQMSIRKIMAYSSINHIGWMIASMNSFSTWLIYFLIYSIISVNIIIIFKENNIFWLSQVSNFLSKSKTFKLTFMMNFLSLGGIPPFLGFFPKWITINLMVEKSFFWLSLILIVFTLITLFFYLRISFLALTINSEENLVSKSKMNLFFSNLTNFFSLSGLIICTMIFNLN
uniref:NADH-ubiquinone oxidoreductase chain 2 n=1 Tax=Demonax pseudonotabilis TaxID=2992285 RepID=A0A9E7V5X4_9CUCU|nr:NADH dehydrogenase subunit 2 [Demonax pseudonotabilis]UYX61158.1 NADH dehydrogenase subunit 2 [Demonax pseudonotabilis]